MKLIQVLALLLTLRSWAKRQAGSGSLHLEPTAFVPGIQDLLAQGLLSPEQAGDAERIAKTLPEIVEALRAQSSLPLTAPHRQDDEEAYFDAEEGDDVFYDALEDQPGSASLLQDEGLQGVRHNCFPVDREEGVRVVMTAGNLGADGILTREEFHTEIGTSPVTTCARDDIRLLSGMSTFMHQDDACGEDEDFEQCLEKQKLALAEGQGRLPYDKLPETAGCLCPSGHRTLVQEDLLPVIEKEKIQQSPLMMRMAANSYCRRLDRATVATWLHSCPAGQRGYCCTELAQPRQDAKEKALLQRVSSISMTVQQVITGSSTIEKEVRDVVAASHVHAQHKAVLYKLFIIYYHHFQVLLNSHQYCLQNPDDLAICEDPMTMVVVWSKLQAIMQKSSHAISVLANCFQHGGRPLSLEYSTNGITGLIYQVLRRSVRAFATGRLVTRVNQLAVALGKTIWRYRFSVMMTVLVVGGVQPMMQAITATGVVSGTATSWSLALELLLRNVMLYVACPLLEDPLLMSMVLRWSMANIILTDQFVNNVIQPLWSLLVMANPAGLAITLAEMTASKVSQMLFWIGDRLRGGNSADEVVYRETWLEAAREFHNKPLADFLYSLLAVWIGGIWRTIAGSMCQAAKVGAAVVGGAQTGMEHGRAVAVGFWGTAGRWISGGIKSVMGDGSAELVSQMATADKAAELGMGMVMPKTLSTIHLALEKVDFISARSLNVGLDAFSLALQYFAESATAMYALSGLFSWFFASQFEPKDQFIAPSDEVLEVARSGDRSSFNENSCEGKKMWEKCMFLTLPSIDKGEDVMEGVCCYNRCQPKEQKCPKMSEKQLEEMAEFDVKSNPISRLQRQSHYLHSFVHMAQTSYGPSCRSED